MTLGQKVKIYRKKAGLSQMELELAIGASPGTISRIENDVVNPLKETLFSIIEKLNLGVEESAEIFNINLSTKVEQLSKLSNELGEARNEKELLHYVTNKLVTKFKVKYSTGWLWEANKHQLNLAAISIPDRALAFILNVLKLPLDKVVFSESDNRHRDNFILKALLENNANITGDMFNFSIPYASREACRFLSKVIGMKLGIHLPLTFKGEKIGVLGFIWPEEEMSNVKIEEFKFIAGLVAAEIYHLRIISKLQNESGTKN